MSTSLNFYRFTGYSNNLLKSSDWNSIYNSVKILFKEDSEFIQRIDDATSKHFEPILLEVTVVDDELISKEIEDYEDKIKYVFNKKKSTFFMVDKSIWIGIEKIIDMDKKTTSEKRQTISAKFEIEEKFIRDYFKLKDCFDNNALFVDIS